MQLATKNNLVEFLEEEVLTVNDIAVALDAQLNYLVVNEAAEKNLGKRAVELIGSNIVELYPSIIASKNHRNLLKSAHGQEILDDVIKNRDGDLFIASYRPVIVNGRVEAIIITARPYPDAPATPGSRH